MATDPPDAQDLLAAPMDPATNPAKASTLREYLAACLGRFHGMWSKIDQVEYPFGRDAGDWHWPAFRALVEAGYVPGYINPPDKYDPIPAVALNDRGVADEVLARAIAGLAEVSVAAPPVR